MKNLVKVAIAGFGRSGCDIHSSVIKNLNDKFKIVSVADEIHERRVHAESEFGAIVYSDYQTMIEDGRFDLFVNSTPSHLHVPATIHALEKGYHVLSEKPIALNLVEFDKLIATVNKTGKILAPFQNNRYQPFFSKITDVLNAGFLGEILDVRSVWGSFSRRWDWQTFQCNGGGCLYNSGPHAIDQALTFFPEPIIPRVESTLLCRNELGGDADDYCCIVLTAPNCPRVEILISQYIAYSPGDIYTISGTRGGLSGNYKNLKWTYYNQKDACNQKIWTPWSIDLKYPKEDLPWRDEVWKLDEVQAGRHSGYTLRSFLTGAKYVYEALYDKIVNDGPLAGTLDEVRRQIQIMEECKLQNPLPQKLDRWESLRT